MKPLFLKEMADQISNDSVEPSRAVYTLTVRENSGLEAALERLTQAPKKENGLHLGWGSFRNLDIVAARRSQHALICDINRFQLNIWSAVTEAIRQTESADAFVRLLARILPDDRPVQQFATSTDDWLLGDLNRAESWLFRGAPERFEYVRSLFLKNAIVFACLDIRGRKTSGERVADDVFLGLEKLLAGNHQQDGFTLDTIYITNIPHALKKPNDFFGAPNSDWSIQIGDERGTWYSLSAYERMWHNLTRICDDKTLMIISEYLRTDCNDDLQWITEADSFPRLMKQHLKRFYDEFPADRANLDFLLGC